MINTECPILASAIRKTNARIELNQKLHDVNIMRIKIKRAEKAKKFAEGQYTYGEHRRYQMKYKRIIKIFRIYRYQIVFGGDENEYKGIMKDINLNSDEQRAYSAYSKLLNEQKQNDTP